ncbi:MAG: hypothetical protein E5Y59_01795 [Mesorhizobium sp.]|nr:MAG: hypothetical protein E5Y59_01795 [Mesorhizobium sp.]
MNTVNNNNALDTAPELDLVRRSAVDRMIDEVQEKCTDIPMLWNMAVGLRQDLEKLPTEPGNRQDVGYYLVWSNEHKAWWGPDNAGYSTTLEAAGRYTRDGAMGICIGARGGRRFNDNPSEVPVLYEDAVLFWQNDKPEWREERARYAYRELDY